MNIFKQVLNNVFNFCNKNINIGNTVYQLQIRDLRGNTWVFYFGGGEGLLDLQFLQVDFSVCQFLRKATLCSTKPPNLRFVPVLYKSKFYQPWQGLHFALVRTVTCPTSLAASQAFIHSKSDALPSPSCDNHKCHLHGRNKSPTPTSFATSTSI